jgi:hypothetical protein
MKRELALLIIGILIMVFCINCTRRAYNVEIAEKVEMLLEKDTLDYDYIVIIPGSGCSGCISIAEQFFLDNVSDGKMKFILTKNASKKGLILRLHEENLKRENVLVDIDNNFYLIGYEEKIYPIIASVKKKKVIQVRQLSS